jgi:hypothetical protein
MASWETHFITRPGSPAGLDHGLQSPFENLRELQGIGRGARGMVVTGGSAEGPASCVLRKAFPVIDLPLPVMPLI